MIVFALAACGSDEEVTAPRTTAAEGVLTVGELRDVPAGLVAVQGFVWSDASGDVLLCEAIAATTPPSCDGASVALSGFGSDELPPLESAGTGSEVVRWSPRPATVIAEVGPVGLQAPP